jgi:hypothetical protein
MAKIYTVQVEEGRLGKDGSPSVGPVYRNALAKDCFPPLEPDMATSWDVFRYPRVRVCVCVCVFVWRYLLLISSISLFGCLIC